MNQLPSPNNVYGSVFSRTGLAKIAEILRNQLGLTQAEVYIDQSQFDHHQILYIITAAYEFETRTASEQNIWHISGSVMGASHFLLFLYIKISAQAKSRAMTIEIIFSLEI
jgi:hypothetical protein